MKGRRYGPSASDYWPISHQSISCNTEWSLPPDDSLNIVSFHTSLLENVDHILLNLDVVPSGGQVLRYAWRIIVIILSDSQVPNQVPPIWMLQEEAQRWRRFESCQPWYWRCHEAVYLCWTKVRRIDEFDGDGYVPAG